MIQRFPIYLFFLVFLASCGDGIPKYEKDHAFWLDEADLSAMEQDWGSPRAKLSCDGNALSVGGKKYKRGIGTHAVSRLMIKVHGTGERFKGAAGVDDESGKQASMEFFILGDKQVLWQSGLMKKGHAAREFDLDISGIDMLALYVSDGGDNIHYDHADWLNVRITYRDSVPEVVHPHVPRPYVLTPPPPAEPRINGPSVYGAGAGKQFLYRIPATGERPMKFSAKGLPAGLNIFEETGLIRGRAPADGTYEVTLTAENEHGKDSKKFKIIVGQGLALTPPMGWNSWNVWGLNVDQQKVKIAARAMEATGLADYGWSYINIDDGWEAPERDETGFLFPNEKFPNIQQLITDIHNMGLKVGIYSSPGPSTCGGYPGSYGHELTDARTWAVWGVDYVKYDWCSYGDIAKDQSLEELQKPYIHFREVLDQVDRDIVYSICQYGRGDVWKWGAEVGGNLWRTTGDITDTWSSMAGIGFGQDGLAAYAGPGHWNDPDMLVVGKLGWGSELRNSRLTPDEQYTHISLWAMLSAPLMLGCDLAQLDPFTLSLLTNHEVLAVNQDPLGKQAIKKFDGVRYQVWTKELADGSLAVGVFNIGKNTPVEAFNWDNDDRRLRITVGADQLGLTGIHRVRDLWRQQDIGTFEKIFVTEVPHHGAVLLKLTKEK
jgi:alpha-galactosidase